MTDAAADFGSPFSVLSAADLPAETQLLLLCARTELDDAGQTALRRLAARPGLDWHRFLEFAIRHGVAPLAHARLRASCPPEVPLEIRRALEERSRAIAFHNLRLAGELARLEKILAAEGIESAWFKGPALAQLAYGNLALREFTDLDLLIPRKSADEVNRLLVEQGYRPLYDLLSLRRQRLHERISNEHAFWHPLKELCVDLHWGLAEHAYSFAERGPLPTRRIEWAGGGIATLDLEETLCYLCYHGSKHGWTSLRWVCDVAELIRRDPGLDWDALTGSRRLPIGTPRMLKLGLILAHSGLGAPLPGPVASWAVSDPKAVSLAQRILQRASVPAKLFEITVYLWTMESAADRLRFWVRRVLQPSPLELEVITLPGFLFFLYVPLRYLRLIGKYARKWGAFGGPNHAP